LVAGRAAARRLPPWAIGQAEAGAGSTIRSVLEREELVLDGGAQTHGVVRVDETVRRPLHPRSEYVHAVLAHLQAVGFDRAPRVLGIDERGREVLSYIGGDVVADAPAFLSDARLISATRLIRDFHDATMGTLLAGDGEVVCHGDLGSHNIVFDGERAVGLIDWDEGVGPGLRLVDFAHAVWCCADVCEEEVEVSEQARKMRLMCRVYGWEDIAVVADEIADRFRRARDAHAAARRSDSVVIFEEMIDWMAQNAPALKAMP
jgi:tRNA A-37 threonylcarbamoyl transferase component Bud32